MVNKLGNFILVNWLIDNCYDHVSVIEGQDWSGGGGSR
jgi:hypothetical protein